MDLPVFFQTAATVSPILLGGTVLALSRLPRPRTLWRERLRTLFVLVPPLVVTMWSLSVLAGESSPETWRAPVFWLLELQVVTGLGGLAGLGLASGAQRQARNEGWRRIYKERRRERRLAAPQSAPQTRADGPRPDATDERAPGF